MPNRLNLTALKQERDELQQQLLTLENLIEEAVGNEIIIARRRDGNIWITDAENTLSGRTLAAAIDAGRTAVPENK